MTTVFLIDDDATLRALYGGALRRAGFDVCAFEGGEAALKAADSGPDVVLCDAEMPGLDGFATCAALRERLTVPVIFLSAHDSLALIHDGLAAGGDDFVAKDAPAETLVSRVAFWASSPLPGLPGAVRRRALALAEQALLAGADQPTPGGLALDDELRCALRARTKGGDVEALVAAELDCDLAALLRYADYVAACQI
jgi:DNA-binding response OmpR family regulator